MAPCAYDQATPMSVAESCTFSNMENNFEFLNPSSVVDSNPPLDNGESSSTSEAAMAVNSEQNHEEATENAPDTFCFETDHVALKTNRDYQNLLKTIVMLESQRTRAIMDLDQLIKCEEEALSDPIEFVHKLQCKVDTGIPKEIKPAQIPNITWENYTCNIDPGNMGHKHSTRYRHDKSGRTSTEATTRCESPVTVVTVQPTASTSSLLQNTACSSLSDVHDSLQSVVVRGRVKTDTKSQSFNQLWSVEEQKRLEELLLKFPPEEVEMRRFDKIARALGSRTTQQVASRVQKYFIKLAKAGLPVPGRLPNMATYTRKGSHRHQRNNRFYFQPSTFMTSYEPPVYMSDDDDTESYCGSITDSYGENSQPSFSTGDAAELSDDDCIPTELRESEQYRELLKWKRLKRQRQNQHTNLVHHGYKCDQCQCEPITGTRWHCADCPHEVSLDLCEACASCTIETATHSSSHKLEPVRCKNSSSLDMDYSVQRFLPGDYNYLDPNYMPTT